MKKIVLSAIIAFSVLAAGAQCDAAATLNEDFSNFTIGTSGVFPQNCWSALAGSQQTGPWVYTAETTDEANQYVTIYGFMSTNTAAYLVTPELSTIDGNHSLTFTAWKPAFNGSVPEGTVTLQPGVMTDPADAATFTAVGEPITVATEEQQHTIQFSAIEGNAYAAIQFMTDTQHNAVAIDNVIWEEAEDTCEAVAGVDEDFNDFVQGFAPVNQSCWTNISEGALLYVDGNDESTESHVTFYTAGTAGSAAYLVSPEISTMDGNHTLVYDAGLVAPTSVVTLQVGTLSDAADASTFVPFGEEITITGTGATMPGIVLPASDTQKYIAFYFTGEGNHDAAFIDNIKWQATAGLADANKATFSMYPNPSEDKNVTISLANAENAAVNIYSLTGAKVFAATLTGRQQNINLGTLTPGVYIVNLTTGNSTVNQKLIIK